MNLRGVIIWQYQFVMGLNTTEKANCRENGFHCAENPLDCLSYYSSLEHSEYYIVNAGGDIDEDEHDSKIACTELTVIKRLTKEELFLHGLAYMVDHPRRVWSSHVAANRAMANCGYAVVRGKDPVATGRLGDILAFAKEAPDSESIVQVAVFRTEIPFDGFDVALPLTADDCGHRLCRSNAGIGNAGLEGETGAAQVLQFVDFPKMEKIGLLCPV